MQGDGTATAAGGPLAGIRVLEFAGIGPGPFAAMLLADLGAEVLRIDRPGLPTPDPRDPVGRGRRTLTLDLKDADQRNLALELIESADALLEGFRPGVMEKLGLGPDPALARNPRLVYGRMTGWGQNGPLAHAAGHDLNYIAITGALDAIGPPAGKPVPPLNLVGDLGGGALFLVMGMLAALLEMRSSGRGQVIDCAISDCVATLMAPFMGLTRMGLWREGRGSNFLDGGAHYYNTYACADGLYVSVAPIEGPFYAQLLHRLGIDPASFGPQNDPQRWPDQGHQLATLFRTQPRAHWCALLEGTDSCFAPVLSLQDAADHPHMRARRVYVEHLGALQPAPAPRFSRTPAVLGERSAEPPTREQILQQWRRALDNKPL